MGKLRIFGTLIVTAGGYYWYATRPPKSWRNDGGLVGQRLPEIPKRNQQLEALKSGKQYDILVIGGGATGTGVALVINLVTTSF